MADLSDPWSEYPDTDALLPRYEDVVAINPWGLVVRYLSRRELRALCLTSKTTEDTALGALWENPAKFFGEDSEDFYWAFTTFSTCLENARLSTRSKTLTLDLKALRSNLAYTSSETADWLRRLLLGLPNLHHLLLHDNPSADKKTFSVLSMRDRTDETQEYEQTQLLTLTSMENLVAHSLRLALSCFPQLVYLDLSYTRAASDPDFTRMWKFLDFFKTLKILKLRGIGLTDLGLEGIASTSYLPRRGIWSLDVRDNLLTDFSIIYLLRKCFPAPDYVEPPSYQEDYEDHASDDQETTEFYRSAARHRKAGLTHLWISNNNISIAGIEMLINTSRLVVLDCARTEGQLLSTSQFPTSTPVQPKYPHPAWPERKLNRMLAKMPVPLNHLKYLRINHQIVTGLCQYNDQSFRRQTDPGFKKQHWWPGFKKQHRWPKWTKDDPKKDPVTTSVLPMAGLRTLVLTGVPSQSSLGWVTKGLQAFINQCATIEATRASSRKYNSSPKTHLRKIVLEIEPPETSQDPALPDDFSFLDRPTEEPENPQKPSSDTDEWAGDVVDILRKHRATAKIKWSGQISIVRSQNH